MTSSCKKNKKKIASVSKKEKEKKEFVQLSDIPAVDEYCSGCKKPGNLVVCDVMKCKKGYHLECIENPPKNIRFSKSIILFFSGIRGTYFQVFHFIIFFF